MQLILDTDHVSILQEENDPAYDRLLRQLDQYPQDETAVTIISFQEQIQGWMAYLNQARKPAEVLRAYAELELVLQYYCMVNVLPLNQDARDRCAELQKQGIRVATMDLRIAAIARSRSRVEGHKRIAREQVAGNKGRADWWVLGGLSPQGSLVGIVGGHLRWGCARHSPLLVLVLATAKVFGAKALGRKNHPPPPRATHRGPPTPAIPRSTHQRPVEKVPRRTFGAWRALRETQAALYKAPRGY
jgi:tRNA(fMet)-specific endonuclease VapC